MKYKILATLDVTDNIMLAHVTVLSKDVGTVSSVKFNLEADVFDFMELSTEHIKNDFVNRIYMYINQNLGIVDSDVNIHWF